MKLISFLQYSFAILLLTMASSCSKNPVTGKSQAFLMSEESEIALGSSNDPAVVAAFGLYQDDILQQFIEQRGQQMASISHRSNLKFEFKILDSPVVNAFALPGGYVYFTRGIMAHFNNEAEFAGVLGHEIGHVTGRHGAIQQRNQIIAQIGLIAGVVLSKEIAQSVDQFQQSIQLLLLKNGRDHESQSDELGVLYSTKVGYDAHQMANFFQTIGRLSEGAGQSLPTFLSTHPDPYDRFNRVNQLATKAQMGVSDKSSLKIVRDDYLRRIEGLVHGDDPRQGYTEGNRFYHPELKFQFSFPSSWKLNNSPQQVQIFPSSGDAAIIMMLSPGSTLEESATKIIEQYKLTLINKRETTINGFPAIVMESKQVNEQDNTTAVQLLSYLIRDGDLIYVFHGMSLPAKFSFYRSEFENTMTSFSRLTDKSKMEVLPDRIRIKTVTQDATLSSALLGFGMANSRLEELSILNGMKTTDVVKKGMLIKTIGK
ncbi:MAG: M48 family metalloprotease [Saprospiraceae bacterium]|nr:M48 family metalloprotease [Saprospiraceae bacterium]